jgi:hypothetical protein
MTHYTRQDAAHQTIRFFSFGTRQITSLVTLDKEPIWNYPDVTLSRDGRLLLYRMLGPGGQRFNAHREFPLSIRAAV